MIGNAANLFIKLSGETYRRPVRPFIVSVTAVSPP
jgi:hypothetical protein